ncbi:hypothetical protein AB0M22_09225 [Nocardia sp. NPDC051756]|uniref:hypothetical protein n=1 Tax=Nocardia sp. NPDC051756 TaxID=3154751 RepID=UPI00341D18F0
MARITKRVCAVPECPAIQAEPRCPKHRTERDRHYRTTTPTKATRTHAERQRRAAAVADHKRKHGNWCPGWQRPAHPATDLTADHVDAIANSGRPDGPLQVLCRACNSSKGDR